MKLCFFRDACDLQREVRRHIIVGGAVAERPCPHVHTYAMHESGTKYQLRIVRCHRTFPWLNLKRLMPCRADLSRELCVRALSFDIFVSSKHCLETLISSLRRPSRLNPMS